MNLTKMIASLGVVAAISLPAFAANKTIVEIAAGDRNFSTLVSLVKKAGLAETLSGKGPFTVFAPTNAAFNKVPKATLDAVAADNAKLKGVLTYHVVSGNVLAKDVVKLNGKEVKTVNGAKVKVTVRNGQVFVNNVRVVRTDIVGSNGVIHVLDGVLLPPAKNDDMQLSTGKTKDGSSCGTCKP